MILLALPSLPPLAPLSWLPLPCPHCQSLPCLPGLTVVVTKKLLADCMLLVQVFATALDAYFQMTVMLMVLFVGSMLLPHLAPFEDQRSQSIQVRLLNCMSHFDQFVQHFTTTLFC